MKRPPLPGAPGAMLGAAPAAHWLAGTARGLRGVLDGFASVAGAARRTAELPALDWAEPALAPDGLHLPDLPERGEPAAQEATQGRGGAKPSAGPVVPSPSGAGNLPPVAPGLLRERLAGHRPERLPASHKAPVSAERLAEAARDMALTDLPDRAPARAMPRPAEAAASRGVAPASSAVTGPARGMALVADLVERWERGQAGGLSGVPTSSPRRGIHEETVKRRPAEALFDPPGARPTAPAPNPAATGRYHGPGGDIAGPAWPPVLPSGDAPSLTERSAPAGFSENPAPRRAPATMPDAPLVREALPAGTDTPARPGLPEAQEDAYGRPTPPEPQQQVHLSVQVALPPQAGAPGADTDDLSRRIKQILVAEARRHGIDLT